MWTASSDSGAVYRAQTNDYEAVCAGRGDSNLQKDFLNVCQSFAFACNPYYMSCVLQGIEQFKDHICNGGYNTMIASTGKWSYRGYSGSIASVSDGRDGACFAICHLSVQGDKYP